MLKADFLTLILIAVFMLPILKGALTRFSPERIQASLRSLCGGLEFIALLLLALYLTRGIFLQHDQGLFARIYNWLPEEIRAPLSGQDILLFIIIAFLIVCLFRSLTGWITRPLYKAISGPPAKRLYRLVTAFGSGPGRIIGALAQIPRAVALVFVCALLLNFSAGYFPSPVLTRMMSDSGGYQLIYQHALSPGLNSSLAREIPVLVNDYFRRDTLAAPAKGPVTTYFNGATLDEAVKSNPQIDATARRLVGSEQDSRQKAYLIYRWITQNIKYDEQKAAGIRQDSGAIASGSIAAFDTRQGICFDYASLYVSMCRAVEVKVRLVTGLAYSGTDWGDHAWNQVYMPKEDRWINIDPTFGAAGNYFDRLGFNADHKDAVVQGEW